MSATPIAVPVQVVWTVTASGQSASVTPATPLQVSVAQVHLGLKGATGDMHPGIPLMVQQAADAAEAAAASADRVDLGALDQAVLDAEASAEAAETARGLAVTAKLAAEAAAADAANKVDKSGGIMTGPLSVPAGAVGAEVPQAQEVVKLAGNQTIGDIKTFSASPVVPLGATGGEAVAADDLFGRAQTWQSVVRGASTTYTNSTGKPIILQVWGNQSVAGGYIALSVDGVSAQFSNLASFASALIGAQVTVPDGSTYMVAWSGMATLNCREYRA